MLYRPRALLRRPRLAVILGSAVAALAALPATAAAAPNGAFASDYGNGAISQFTFGTGDTLSANGSVSAGSEPWFESVTPNGKYLYVANWGDGSVSQYSIGADETLTPLSPASVSAGPSNGSIQVAVSPDGRNAYAVNDNGYLTVFNIGSDGTLTSAQTITSGLSGADAVAVSPDGSSVYVGDSGNGEIFQYDRASSGALTPKAIGSVSGSDVGYLDLAITPNGKYLYESSESGTIYEYSVGTGGELSALTPASVSTGQNAYSVIISPNGQNAYSSSCSGNYVYQYTVGSDGQLAPLSPATVATDGCGLPWMTANGGSFYVPDFSSSVYQYDVSSTGALTPKTPATATFSGASELWGFIIPPDQGPVAAFSATAGKAGKATKFNGSASSDSDGTVAVYDWSFGDGHSLSNGGATPSHTYRKAGKYKVTLTVTDDSGCSLTQVFTGQTAYCNGTPAARIVHTVKVVSSTKPLKLSVSPHSAKAGRSTCYVLRATSGGHGVKKVTVRLAGHKATTSANGKAKLCLVLKKGTYHARATKTGYKSAVAAIRVTAASPVFTG